MTAFCAGDFFALKKAMNVLEEAELSEEAPWEGGKNAEFWFMPEGMCSLGTKFTKLLSGGTKPQWDQNLHDQTHLENRVSGCKMGA